MDTIFAILVLAAIIMLGALISMGNERQRRAIDGIREQTARWAEQDLRMKREKLARDVRMDDPVKWLNRAVQAVYGENLNLVVTDFSAEPEVMICHSQDNGQRVALASQSPDDLKRMTKARKSKLARLGNQHPLLPYPRGLEARELSILNAGLLFDLEANEAWQKLGGSTLPGDRLWMYVFSRQ